jgi:uncharacterized membrane protein (UPF0127 family)
MNKQKICALVLCTLVVFSGIMAGIFYFQPNSNMPQTIETDRIIEVESTPGDSVKWGSVTVGAENFKVEIADTDARRQRGLMWREVMPSNTGMLFVFDQVNFHSFWMKNTLIPLDMVWLDSALNVVDIQTVEPCPLTASYCPSYRPAAPAKYVLEVNAYQFPGVVGDKVVVQE